MSQPKRVKLRVFLKRLKRAADDMERMARELGLPLFSAENSRRKIRRLRIERPDKRRARGWTTASRLGLVRPEEEVPPGRQEIP